MDVTQDTVSSDKLVTGYSAHSANGVQINGNIATKSAANLTASGSTVTVPAGFYASQATKNVSAATQATPAISLTSSTGVVTAVSTQTAGYVAAGSKSSSLSLSTQAAATITPSESEQTAVASYKWTTGIVKVAAISSDYVGSNIAQRSSADLTSSGATVTAPAGFYSASASKSVSSMTLPTSAATTSSGTSKATIATSTSTRYLNIPTGYNSTAQYYTISGMSTMTLPTSAATSSTSGYTSKATISRSTSDQYINIPTGYNSSGAYYKISAVANGSVTSPSTISGTSATLSTGTNTLTLTKTVSVTPVVSTAGYVSSGTAGNASVSLAASVTTQGAKTITPSTSQQTAVSSGTYVTGNVVVSAMPAGTAGTPTATKGSVSNHSISVTPSVTNTTGYITGSTKTGTAVTVSASELVSGTLSINANGTYGVTNYQNVDVDVSSNDFVVTLSQDQQGDWNPDCTFAEAYAAYTGGKNVVFNTDTDYTPVNGEYSSGNSAFIYIVNEFFDNDDPYYYGYRGKGYFWRSSGITIDDDQRYYAMYGANAQPSDVANGKIFYNSNGYQVGTAALVYNSTTEELTLPGWAVTLA